MNNFLNIVQTRVQLDRSVVEVGVELEKRRVMLMDDDSFVVGWRNDGITHLIDLRAEPSDDNLEDPLRVHPFPFEDGLFQLDNKEAVICDKDRIGRATRRFVAPFVRDDGTLPRRALLLAV